MEARSDSSFDSSRIFKLMLENSRTCAIIIMDENGYILDCNAGVENSFGYTRNDLAGRNFEILFTDYDRSIDRPEIELATTLQRGSSTDQNYIVRKDGEHVWVNGETIFTKDEKGKVFLVKLVYDINEQKLLQKFLAVSNKFSDSIIETITEPLIVLDRNFRIIRTNKAYLAAFKANFQDIQSRLFFIIDEGIWNLPELKKKLEDVLAKGISVSNFEHSYFSKRAGHKLISLNARPIEQEGLNEMILLVLRDITDIRRKEQQKDDFLSMASHELKTPITTLKAYSQLAKKLCDDNSQLSKYLEGIEKQVNNLNDLVSDLLDVTKIHAGKLKFNIRSFDFDALVKETIETLQLSNPTHRLTVDAPANITIEADKDRTGQVITNFITNAVKYSPKADKVRIMIHPENEGVTLCVRDYGIGIEEKHLDHIFDRFYRVDESSRVAGLGMGLFISRQIIERQGGRIWAESKPGEGSTFCFWLPLRQKEIK